MVADFSPKETLEPAQAGEGNVKGAAEGQAWPRGQGSKGDGVSPDDSDLVRRFHQALGKSTGAQSLYDHVLGATSVAQQVLERFAGTYPTQKREQLLFATFVHDLGKLDPDFQAMLRAAVAHQPLPGKRVKHEASTLLFQSDLEQGWCPVVAELERCLGLTFKEPPSLILALAFAATHHGLFYLSLEETQRYGTKWLIRREWTVTNRRELARITLTDLLFLYHPFGGLVMVGDLIQSFCHEKGFSPQEVLSQAGSYHGLVAGLLQRAGELEEVLEKEDPRGNRGLGNILKLLLEGVK